MSSVSKRFGAVTAVDSITLTLEPGQVHAIVGENGAGKSTLVNILSGAIEPDHGSVLVDEEPARFKSPADAISAGVATIYQERALVPELTIAENIVLGREPGAAKLIRANETDRIARKFLAQVGLPLTPKLPVRRLRPAAQQLVAIAKALSLQARLLILDEPTAALTADEAENLLALLTRLREQNLAILYITHRLKEVVRLADRVSVLKDGQLVRTMAAEESDEETIVRLMVGREVDRLFPELPPPSNQVVIEAHGVEISGELRGVSLTVHAGEIVGIAGLEGSGKSSLASVLSGARRPDAGQIIVNGASLHHRGVQEALARGIGYIPPDRRSQGLVGTFTVRESITLASLKRHSRAGLLSLRGERRVAEQAQGRLQIRTPSIDAPIRSLSGGNQQKVIFARALVGDARILICDEPTAGVDVGARAEIYAILAELAAAGAGIVVVSSDALELLGLCHRIVVLTEGRVAAEFSHGAVSEEELVRAQLPREEEVVVAA